MASTPSSQTILVVDPEEDFTSWVSKHLAADTISVIAAHDGPAALQAFADHSPDLIIAEHHMAPMTGLEFLKKVRGTDPNAMVVLTTGFPPTNAVIEAMRLGAHDFLRKGTLQYELRPIAEAALSAREEVLAAGLKATEEIDLDTHQDTIIGKSPAMQEVFKMVGRVSRGDAPVLITGESGSGKEIIAQAVHKFSPRSGADFVAINCAALPDNLLESELFGHEKGSFTGATATRVGRFEQCDGGTLFLDEIGDMAASTQSKILRVLQEGEFSRVGGNENIKSDVRILAATNKNLEAAITTGAFREDLFYRLNVIRIHLPPLRERQEDIAPLADHFLAKIAAAKRIPRLRLTPESATMLQSYTWPGNVRELDNTMQRACALANTDTLLPKDIPLGTPSPNSIAPIPQNGAEDTPPGEIEVGDSGDKVAAAVRTLIAAAEADPDLALLPFLEREMTAHAFKHTDGNQVQTAKLLGITRTTLRKRLERYGIVKEPAES